MKVLFLHQVDYDDLTCKCPPDEFESMEIKAYRWVFNEITDPMNFISQYHKKPKRFLGSTDEEKCTAMGISLFTSKEKAKERFEFLKTSMGENVYIEIGTNIAEGTLNKGDGVSGHFNEKTGHFTHHKGENVDYQAKFAIIEKLDDEGD